MDGQYEAVAELGAGAFGKVLLIENEANREEKYAMKMLNLLQHGIGGTEAIVQEINLLASLSHEHVLEYVTCFEQLPFICIVTEYCPNGNLAGKPAVLNAKIGQFSARDHILMQEFVEKRRGTKLSEYRLVVWFKQIGSAVEYLHSNNVIHRDLKLLNVFLNGDMDCVVGDLGVARVLQSQTDLATTAAGTYLYMSPEIFLGIPYNAKTDIWSLGVMMYELAALEKPFNSFSLPLLIHQVTMGQKPVIPKGYCSDFSDLVLSMLEKVPQNRPTSTQVMQHKLFKREFEPQPLARYKTTVQQKKQPIKDAGVTDCLQQFMRAKQLARQAKERVKKQIARRESELAVGDADRKPPSSKKFTNAIDVNSPLPEVKTVTMTMPEMLEKSKEVKTEVFNTTLLKGQFEEYKKHCMNVLQDDNILFKEASMALNKSGQKGNIQEKLLSILGEEKFKECGVQLLYYKNIGHNLKKK